MPDETPTAPHARLQPSASYSFTMRLHLSQESGAFARVAQAIAEAEALLGAIDLVRVEPHEVVRDVTVACVDSNHAEAVVRAVRELEGVRVDSVSDRTFRVGFESVLRQREIGPRLGPRVAGAWPAVRHETA